MEGEEGGKRMEGEEEDREECNGKRDNIEDKQKDDI